MPGTLGHYKLLNLVGSGRMGELYRARDMRAGRTVAVRVVADNIHDNPGTRERFLKDARATAALSHPNIAALYEIGDDGGHLFLVSEFVPGDTLNTVIAGRPLNPRHALDYGIQLADALAEGHAVGMVCHDLRPANVIVTPKGTAKLLDFGLAKWTSSEAERSGFYMSPEQLAGAPLDQRTDIFSLGIVLFEMLTGRVPFTAPGANAVVKQIQQIPMPAPSTVNRTLAAALDPVVLKMLARDAGQRSDMAAVVAADLRALVVALDSGGLVANSSTGARPANADRQLRAVRVRPTLRRSVFWIRIILVAAAVAAVILLLASGVGERWWSSLLRTWRQSGRGVQMFGSSLDRSA